MGDARAGAQPGQGRFLDLKGLPAQDLSGRRAAEAKSGAGGRTGENKQAKIIGASKPGAAEDVEAYIAARPEATRPMPKSDARDSLVGRAARRGMICDGILATAVLDGLKKYLAGYGTSKGTIRFLLDLRLTENEAKRRK